MKRKALFFLLLLSLSLHAANVTTTGDGGYIEDKDFSLSLSSGKTYFKYGYLTVGEIDRKGLLRTIKNPYYETFSVLPAATKYRKKGSHNSGVLFSFPSFYFGWTTSGRSAVFSSLSYKYIDVSLVYAFKDEEDESYQREIGEADLYDTAYLLLKSTYKFLTLSLILSYSPPIGIVPLAKIEAKWNKYSLYFIAGDTIDYSLDSDNYTLGAGASIGEEGFKSTFSYSVGQSVIYSGKTLVRRGTLKSALTFKGLVLYSYSSFRISKTGLTHKEDKFSLRSDIIEIGWSSEDGLFYFVNVKDITVGFEDHSFYLSMKIKMGGANIALVFGKAASFSLSFSLL